MTAPQPPLVFGWPEIGVFLLANAIVFYICFPKLWQDIKRWRREG
ncbi:MAG: hypothetical protein ACK4YP_05550 [Myxococcota bacterium]